MCVERKRRGAAATRSRGAPCNHERYNIAPQPSWLLLATHLCALPPLQLNMGVAWLKASRRMADTLNFISEAIRAQPVWDQAVFAETLLLPGSTRRPWAGRHSVRVMDPLVYPNTCEANTPALCTALSIPQGSAPSGAVVAHISAIHPAKAVVPSPLLRQPQLVAHS